MADKFVKLEIINPAGRIIVGVGGGEQGTVIEVHEAMANMLLAMDPNSYRKVAPPKAAASTPEKPEKPEKKDKEA